ncbi:MAG TPA: porin [Panacibacter sp.]|nr:porin [Panacibacter sp.]HNP44553.1 porin [Panacibacter sp.]
MNLLLTRKCFALCIFLSFSTQLINAQFLMDMIDTTKETGKGLLNIYKKYDHVKFSGYIQPQFQMAESKGIKSYSGGDFSPNSDNRFMIRRGRFRLDYMHFSDNTKPSVQFVFQIDASERGVFMRDLWGRVFENNAKLFSFTTGMFARPFGYEVNLSSADRESPERGRMSQILMKTERDLGAMVSFEPRERQNWLKYVKWDVGVFNGQGLTSPTDYDSYKDVITRIGMKPYPLKKNLLLSTGVSLFEGGLFQNDKYLYTMDTKGGNNPAFVLDSSSENIGQKLPRQYYGADAQLKWIHKKSSATDFRAEYWQGTQTASDVSSETPTTLSTLLTDKFYVRNFNGYFIYLLHSFDKHSQVGLKFDSYDPNTKVKGMEIGGNNGTHSADIKYNTLGIGYIYYVDENLKIVTWYDIVKNETTSLQGYTSDLKDNVLTIRFQFRF